MEESKLSAKRTELKPLVKVDAEKCVNCHQCISVCPSKLCNDGSGDHVDVNPDLCIGCGACIEACTHSARSGIDDFEAFIDALKNGKKIVAIVAPAIAANFPDRYLQFNGWLKSIEVGASFDVSFGAELTVKSYLEALKKRGLKHVIAQPCPALVGYIEVYLPELIGYLAPADSPMMHAMKMIREYYPEYRNSEIAVISPCYAKRREFDEVGIGNYNVTFQSIAGHFRKKGIDLSRFDRVPYDNPAAERAVLFSTPGGLLRTVRREVPGIEASARKIEGRHIVYQYLAHFMDAIHRGIAPLLVDCLNCEMGCNGGPGTLNVGKSIEEVESLIEKRNLSAQQDYLRQAGLFGKRSAIKKLRRTIDLHWKEGLYDRRYTDRSALKEKWIRIPSSRELAEINKSMYKTKQSDMLNCCSCGYNNCEQMAVAIFNKLNKPENCRHFQEIHIVKTQERAHEDSAAQRKQTVSRIALSFQEAIDHLTSVASASEQMSASIREISKNADKSHSVSREISAKSIAVTSIVKQLAEAAKGISTFVTIINDISSQTNLLALNATIEAASAGDAGKGFAVVALEVKELSKKAAKAANEITMMLEKIQNSFQKAVSNVDAISEKINESESFINSIASSIEEQTAVTTDISHSISTVLDNIKNGISTINQA